MGAWWGFDLIKNQFPHPQGTLLCQIPTTIMGTVGTGLWGFDIVGLSMVSPCARVVQNPHPLGLATVQIPYQIPTHAREGGSGA